MNRVELAGECARAAVEALAVAAPGWVWQVLEVPGWEGQAGGTRAGLRG
ncbi:hypothetical protein ACIHFD_10665 [Nonomuraea sp. NPDC051941]